MMGTWVAHIPWLQEHIGISKATLGLCLLFIAAGALVSMPLTGHILDSRSSASVTRAATLIFCLMLPLPLLATSPIMLAAILFVFGASGGAMDVAMNAHGVAVERELGRPIMSSLHGGWSVGGFLSAGLVAIAAAAGVDPRLESLLAGVALWVAALWITTAAGERVGAFRGGERVRAAVACRAPDRRTVLPGDDDGGRDRRLERDLPPSQRRRERRCGGDGVHRLLPRDGRRAARR